MTWLHVLRAFALLYGLAVLGQSLYVFTLPRTGLVRYAPPWHIYLLASSMNLSVAFMCLDIYSRWDKPTVDWRTPFALVIFTTTHAGLWLMVREFGRRRPPEVQES